MGCQPPVIKDLDHYSGKGLCRHSYSLCPIGNYTSSEVDIKFVTLLHLIRVTLYHRQTGVNGVAVENAGK